MLVCPYVKAANVNVVCTKYNKAGEPVLPRFWLLRTQSLTAMASISTSAPLGRSFTAKAARAGQSPVKNLA